MIVIAPAGQGKDTYFAAPLTIDAPGPCMVTTAKPDAFTTTFAMRAAVGKVYVWDPWERVSWPERLQWSPILGCESPGAAAYAAQLLVEGAGFELEGSGTQLLNISQGTNTLSYYMYAAALVGKSMPDLLRWVRNPDDPEPLRILEASEADGTGVAVGWAGDLRAQLALPPQDRQNVWTVITQSLAAFTDPAVLKACTVDPGATPFDLEEFLSGRNTLYIIAKDKHLRAGIGPASNVLVEGIMDASRGIAQTRPNSRLDPPFTVVYNDVALVAPLDDMPRYVKDNGSFSIATHVYLQSIAQARTKWGDMQAADMFQNAAIRVVMGGGGNPATLQDISDLLGKVPDSDEPIMSVDELRTQKPGRAIIMARTARPVEMKLTSWWDRKDGDRIAAGKEWTERQISEYRQAQAAATARQRDASVPKWEHTRWEHTHQL